VGSDRTKLDPASAIDAILSQKYVPARIKRREASQLIVEHLRQHGNLIQAPGNRQFWFDQLNTHLYDLDGFAFRTHLIQVYRINPAEPEFRHIYEAMKAATRTHGKRVNVYRFSYYEHAKNLLYISAGQGKVVRLDGKQIVWVSNGSDGILFEETEDAQVIPDAAVTLQLADDPLDQVLLGRINFQSHRVD
jgi:hypothetical protein